MKGNEMEHDCEVTKHIIELGSGMFEMAATSCRSTGSDNRLYEVPTLVFNRVPDANVESEDFIIDENTIFAPFECAKDIERMIVRARGLVEGCEVQLLNNVTVRIVKQSAVEVFAAYLEELVKLTYQEDLPKLLNVSN